jgi:maleylacetate reductase
LRFNAVAVPNALALLGDALDTDDPPARIAELARLGGFERLRDFVVPEDELASVAGDVAQRPGARANPRPASPSEIEELLRSIW